MNRKLNSFFLLSWIFLAEYVYFSFYSISWNLKRSNPFISFLLIWLNTLVFFFCALLRYGHMVYGVRCMYAQNAFDLNRYCFLVLLLLFFSSIFLLLRICIAILLYFNTMCRIGCIFFSWKFSGNRNWNFWTQKNNSDTHTREKRESTKIDKIYMYFLHREIERL